MLYWLDIEFGSGDFLSVGIVCEDGRQLHLLKSEVDDIERHLVSFTAFGKAEFWTYCDYKHWVDFCGCFAFLMGLPKGFSVYCQNLKVECDRIHNLELPSLPDGSYNSLEKAKWNKKVWELFKV